MNFSNVTQANNPENNLTFICQCNSTIGEYMASRFLINRLNQKPSLTYLEFNKLINDHEKELSKNVISNIIIATAESGNNEILLALVSRFGKKLLNVGNHSYLTPLCLAVKNKHYYTTLQLLSLNAELNSIMPFFYVSVEGSLQVKDSISTQMNENKLFFKFTRSALTIAADVDDNIKIVALLLRHGAQTHWFKDGETKIHESIQKANQLIAKENANFTFLLSGRIDPKSFLNQVPKEIFFSIINCMLWS